MQEKFHYTKLERVMKRHMSPIPSESFSEFNSFECFRSTPRLKDYQLNLVETFE